MAFGDQQSFKRLKSFNHTQRVKNKQRFAKLMFMFITLLACQPLLFACAPNEQAQSQGDYQETKQMVLDILQTEEGKKAIQESMGEAGAEEQQLKNLQSRLILSDPQMRQQLQETLFSPENKQQFQELMSDPEFVKEYAKQFEDEHKDMLKDLMKDPEYRAAFMEILKDPEMESHYAELMKSNVYRQQTMTVMKESLESPYFRLEILELLSQIVADPMKMQKGQEGGGEGEGGGGDGEGGGSGGGGGS